MEVNFRGIIQSNFIQLMRTIILKYTSLVFFIFVSAFFSSHTFAQEKCTVKGNVTINGGDLNSVKITLYKDSEQYCNCRRRHGYSGASSRSAALDHERSF